MTATDTTAPAALTGPGTATYPLLERHDQDPSGLLTIHELDQGSGMIRADLMSSIQPGHEKRAASLAVCAFLLARREDPRVKLAAFRDLTVVQLADLLWPDPPPAPAEPQGDDEHQGDDVDSDQPADDTDPLRVELDARPTEPAPAP